LRFFDKKKKKKKKDEGVVNIDKSPKLSELLNNTFLIKVYQMFMATNIF
jgi:hypothetical protein